MKNHIFPFTYLELANGNNSAQTKEILCEPHLKLIRPDSDLRIYFSWSDPEVGEGEKVLTRASVKQEFPQPL